MKDVAAVLGEWDSDGPIHIELVASGVEDGTPKQTMHVGLKAIAKALASCPPISAELAGPVRFEAESEGDSLVLCLMIGAVSVNIVIQADSERIGDNARVTVHEYIA